MKECGLEKIQITLDGIEEIYEEAKQVKKGSFKQVINNIKLLAKNDITVHIRMNYGDNFDILENLILYLKENIGFNKRIFYYVHPIFKKKEAVSREVIEKIIKLNDLMVENGLMKNTDLYNFKYRQTRCFASNYNGYTIAPDGKLYNCSHIMNSKGEIGNVSKYSRYNPKRLEFVDITILEKCKDCILYPICKGGCRASELGLDDLNQCIIYKSGIDMVLEKILSFDK